MNLWLKVMILLIVFNGFGYSRPEMRCGEFGGWVDTEKAKEFRDKVLLATSCVEEKFERTGGAQRDCCFRYQEICLKARTVRALCNPNSEWDDWNRSDYESWMLRFCENRKSKPTKEACAAHRRKQPPPSSKCGDYDYKDCESYTWKETKGAVPEFVRTKTTKHVGKPTGHTGTTETTGPTGPTGTIGSIGTIGTIRTTGPTGESPLLSAANELILCLPLFILCLFIRIVI